MAKAREAKINGVVVGHFIECPACGHAHLFNNENHPDAHQAKWWFNGDLESPTFRPSMLSQVIARDGVTVQSQCHSYVRDGRIEFMPDCTHGMAGQTVDLPDMDGDHDGRV